MWNPFKKFQQRRRRAHFYAALRSGNYEQGQGKLQRDGKFCCLGVACDVAIKDGLNLDVVPLRTGTAYNQDSYHLPESVVDWYGFGNYNPKLQFPGGTITATEANDRDGLDFGQIADAFERTYR